MRVKGFEFSVREFAGSLGHAHEGHSVNLFGSDFLSLVNIFKTLPLFVVGVMLLMSSFELEKILLKIQGNKEISITVVTAVLATVFNMAVDFIGGLILYIAIEKSIVQIR